MSELDLLAFPLHGRQLIEASAGTGKTYSITALYVRALLGHGLLGHGLGEAAGSSADAAQGAHRAARNARAERQIAFEFAVDAPRGAQHFGVPIPIEQLLVVTFTEAATEELRARIRARLLEVRKRLQTGERAQDDFVEQLVAQMPGEPMPGDGMPGDGMPGDGMSGDGMPGDGMPGNMVARNLALIERALGALDAAAVYTIHGFCQRALQEYAFESQVPFSESFVLDGDAFLRAAVSDAWRRLMYSAGELAFAQLQRAFPTPDALWKIVAPALKREDLQLTGVQSISVAAAVAALEAAIIEFKDTARAMKLVASLPTARLSANQKDGPAKPAHIAAMAALLTAPQATGKGAEGGDVVSFIALYGTAALDKALRKNAQATFNTARVGVAADRVVDASLDLRACALRQVLSEARVGAAQEKARVGVVSSDDLLTRTRSALLGPRGALFAARLRERYPLAMIDEFQDTDVNQWQIFARIYSPPQAPKQAPQHASQHASQQTPQRAPQSESTCVLIGDPKQAIYGFRGADIYSYLDARAEIGEDGIHRLTHTRRASPALANAFNALYAAAGPGAFMLDSIRYVPVASAVTGTSFTRAGVEQPALNFWHLPTAAAIAKSALVPLMAAAVAQRIDALLRDNFSIDGAPLLPADLAILVRNGKEALVMRRALRGVGRDSAFLTRESVFNSDAAQFVRWLLIALRDPNDDTRLRAVLASPIGGWGPSQLQASARDESLWEREQSRLQDLLACGIERGVLAMLRQLVSDFALSTRWLAQDDGARWLTDLRHLGELLAAESARLGGGARLLRWLEQRMAAALPDDEFRVRLETDEALIKIVTLHSAKGLEYPVVILPFMTAARGQEEGVHHVEDHSAGAGDRGVALRHVAVVDLAGDSAVQVDNERLAEDLRLLYVGMTRAKRACFLGVANCESKRVGVQRSALGRLLLGSTYVEGSDAPMPGPTSGPIPGPMSDLLTSRMAALSVACPSIAVEVLGGNVEAAPDDSDPASTVVNAARHASAASEVSTAPAAAALQVRQFTGRIDASWRINSYSSLTRDASSLTGTSQAARGSGAEYTAPGVDDEDVVVNPLALDISAAIQYQFTRGASAGVVLHRLFERWPDGDDPSAFVATELRNSGLGGDEAQAAAVTRWLERVRSQPLGPLTVSLAQLRDTRAEMEFSLPIDRLRTHRLSAVLNRFGYRGDALSVQTVAGMLKGFIDLVFSYQNSYYIVDYKSNFLGGNAASYAPEHIANAMRDHRYDLQFLLYAVALRRWLRVHGVANATPQVIYLFLRGIDAEGAGIYHHVPAPGVLDAIDELFH